MRVQLLGADSGRRSDAAGSSDDRDLFKTQPLAAGGRSAPYITAAAAQTALGPSHRPASGSSSPPDPAATLVLRAGGHSRLRVPVREAAVRASESRRLGLRVAADSARTSAASGSRVWQQLPLLYGPSRRGRAALAASFSGDSGLATPPSAPRRQAPSGGGGVVASPVALALSGSEAESCLASGDSESGPASLTRVADVSLSPCAPTSPRSLSRGSSDRGSASCLGGPGSVPESPDSSGGSDGPSSEERLVWRPGARLPEGGAPPLARRGAPPLGG